LLELASFGELGFKGGDIGVHVAQYRRDGYLLSNGRGVS